jgi:TolA-binding protein
MRSCAGIAVLAGLLACGWPCPGSLRGQAPLLPAPGFSGARPVTDDDGAPLAPLTDLKTQLQKMRSQREALDADRAKAAQFLHDLPTGDSEENTKLRQRLNSLLTDLGKGRDTSSPPLQPVANPELKQLDPKPRSEKKKQAEATPSAPKSDVPAAEPKNVVDPFALGHALFRAGNYEGALQAYRMIPLTGLKIQERAPIRYMIATCLRRLNKTEEAATVYREVANMTGDEMVAHCAQWQLTSLRWHKELSDQLLDLHRRREALDRPPTASAP